MRPRDSGVVRFARGVKKAFGRADDNFRQMAEVIQELNERLTELEEYVAGDDREGRG